MVKRDREVHMHKEMGAERGSRRRVNVIDISGEVDYVRAKRWKADNNDRQATDRIRRKQRKWQ